MPFAKLKSIRNALRRFVSAEQGNIALMGTASFIPLVAAAGISLDMARINYAKAMAQAAADSAVLAAAQGTGTDAERETRGLDIGAKNLSSVMGVTIVPHVDYSNDTASAKFNVKVDGTFSAILFSKASPGTDFGKEPSHLSDGIDIVVTSKAFRQAGKVHERCVIALHPTDADTLHVFGSGSLTAVNCGVHSDSASATASLHRQGSSDMTADEFTSVGKYMNTGGGGTISPAPEEFSTPTGDPLASLAPAAAPGGACTAISAHGTTRNLASGKYCSLSMSGNNGRINLAAGGTYWIDGPITFSGNNPTLAGTGVTLILGPAAYIDMGAQGILRVQARTDGPHPGLVVIQKTANAGVNHTLRGGPTTWLRGAWYTPQAKLDLGGNSDFNVDSQYFPIISNKIRTFGTSDISVRFDHAFYGFPKIEQLYTAESAEVRLTE